MVEIKMAKALAVEIPKLELSSQGSGTSGSSPTGFDASAMLPL